MGFLLDSLIARIAVGTISKRPSPASSQRNGQTERSK